MTFKRVFLVMGMSAMLVGCGAAANNNGTPTKWEGATRHLKIVGTIMGEMLNIDVSGAAAMDTANLWCEREYQVPSDANGMPNYAAGHNSEVRIKAPVMVAGAPRLIDLGLKRHDFQLDPAGHNVPVIPRDDANSPCGLNSCSNDSMWLSWTWRDATTKAATYKMAAVSGTYTTGEFTGTPDQTGLMIPENTGSVGGFATGQWSATESLTISFDASCTTNQIDNSY